MEGVFCSGAGVSLLFGIGEEDAADGIDDCSLDDPLA